MFEIGETVLYGTEGVCKITEIMEMKCGSTRAKYYVLKPIHRDSATIYVPLNNERLLERMRRVLSAQEIDELLRSVTQEELAWIDDANERRQEYAKILTAGDRLDVVRLIRALYLRRQSLVAVGKHLRTSDEQLLRDAEKLLNDEFALVLDIPQREVPEYIRTHIENAG